MLGRRVVPTDPDHLVVLAQACRRRERMRFVYRARDGAATYRHVEPLRLVHAHGRWYLVAYDLDREDWRTFRVDRIVEAVPIDETATRPDGFSLSAEWREVVDRVEQKRSQTWATVVVDHRFVAVLQDHFGRHFHPEGETPDGRARVLLGAPTPLDIARNLAGWGALVDVLDPPEVQDHLARIGAELTLRYEDN
jgi:predicted DNA-binding transcriptional regulator YafY